MIRSKQQGFTLIELIMVIVILGILAATALPKFVDLGSDARKSTIEAVAGGVKSAIAITRSAYLVKGDNTLTTINSVLVSAGTGFPTGALGGIGAAIDLTDFDVSYGTSTTITANNATTPAKCQVTFDANSGAVSIDVTDC